MTNKELHNIKSTLSVISGYLQLLDKKASDTKCDPVMKEWTEKALKNLAILIDAIQKLEPKNDP